MVKVIGVRFRTAGKIYYFDPLQFQIKRGDHVIVETARGIEFGTVMSEISEVEEEKVVQPLKPVLRIATQRDLEQEASNKEKEKQAFRICQEKIQKHGLEMKLIDAEYTFDNNKVLFYFTADGRIDFRELVKDLASVFKTRIELRQIGVRDETKIRGGIGICGRPLCCHSYLADFVPVSIKMAKEQNLSLNPTKISGVCGRLMCCLKNEEDTYEELNRRLPGIGDYVTTVDGLKGEVSGVNVLRQLVKVIVDVDDEKEIREYKVEDLQFKKRHGKKEQIDLSNEEMKELERLEQEEEKEISENTESRNPQKQNNSEEKADNCQERQERRSARRSNQSDNKGREQTEGRPERGSHGRRDGKPKRNQENREEAREQNRESGQNREPGQNREENVKGNHRNRHRHYDRNRNRQEGKTGSGEHTEKE